MADEISVEETARFVRLSLPMMAKHGIPITPTNYTVWYTYVSGGNTELNKKIDETIADGEPFSDGLNETLYQQFCAGQDENVLRELRDDLKQILLTIFKDVSELSEHSDQHESIITRHVDRLSDVSSPQHIREVVQDILAETKKISQSGRRMRDRLREATDQLEKLQQEFEVAKTESLVDFLTGLANRKAFDKALDKAAAETVRDKTQTSLLMIDIDRFKNLNDAHGHLVGDEVLKYVSGKIRRNTREADFVARFGGEEFAIILPNTDLLRAKAVAEYVRQILNEKSLKRATDKESIGKISVSIGTAQYRYGEGPDELIERADQALYLAKESGRNCVITEKDLARG